MRIWILLLSCFLLPRIGISQEYQLTYTAKDAARKMVYLGSFFGERISPVDSARADDNGKVQFKLSSGRAPGMYRFLLNKQQFTDFIFNHEEVDILLDFENSEDGIVIRKSEENKLYYGFLKAEKEFRTKISLLLPLLDEYPRKDPFYAEILDKAGKLQQEYQKAAENVQKKAPTSFALKLIRLRMDLPIKFAFGPDERKSDLKLRFFEGKNFSDSALLRSNAYPNKLIEYLSLYANPEFSQSQLEKEFIRAVDMIFTKVQMSREIYDYALSYLAGGFEKFKFETVLVHIHENYLSGLLCDEDKAKKDLAFRLEAFRKLAIGKQIPDAILHLPDGKVSSVSQETTGYTLLVFWAAWCPHCTQMLPELDKLSVQIPDQKLRIIDISLDTSIMARESVLAKLNGKMLHQCDFKGWESPWVNDFHIYATPTMFLVDRNRVIKAKPITLNDLADALTELNLR